MTHRVSPLTRRVISLQMPCQTHKPFDSMTQRIISDIPFSASESGKGIGNKVHTPVDIKELRTIECLACRLLQWSLPPQGSEAMAGVVKGIAGLGLWYPDTTNLPAEPST